MLIQELLSDSYEWTEKTSGTDSSPISYSARFRAKNSEIVVDIDQKSPDEPHWEVAFGVLQKKDWGDSVSLSLSGTGDEYRIFSTVIKIIKNFLNRHDVQTLSFSAEKNEGARARLYQKMVERLVGGEWEHVTDHTSSSDYRSYFTIKRKG